MKKSFLLRAIAPLFACWAGMVLFPETLLAKVAAVIAAAILLACAFIAIVVAALIITAPARVTACDLSRFSKASFADHAAVGIVFTASGFTLMGGGWIVVALIRAGIAFWAQDVVGEAENL